MCHFTNLGIRKEYHKKRLKRRQGFLSVRRRYGGNVDCEESCIGYSPRSPSSDSPVMRFLLSHDVLMTRVLPQGYSTLCTFTELNRLLADFNSTSVFVRVICVNK